MAKNFSFKRLYSDYVELKSFLPKNEVKLYHFVVPFFLSLIVAALDGLSIGLLIPLLQGVLGGDFGFVKDIPVLGKILNFFPNFFSSPDFSTFVAILALIFVATVMKNFISYWNGLIIGYRSIKISNNVKKILFDRYLSFGKLFFDRNNAGYLQNVLLGYSEVINNLIIICILLIQWFVSLCVYIAIMLLISVKLTLITLLLFPVLYFSLGFIIGKIKKLSSRSQEASNELSKNIYNILSGIPLIKAYNCEEKERKNFSNLVEELSKNNFRVQKVSSIISPIQQTVTLLVISVLVLVMSYMFLKTKTGDIAGFIVFFYTLRKFVSSAEQVNSFRSSFATSSALLAEIRKMMNDDEKFFVYSGKKEFKSLKDKIEIKNLNFSYDDNIDVLKGVNFSIKKGQNTSIVGPTGSGKTTLAHLLLRFYEVNSGKIFIDGIDIKEYDIKSLRDKISFVSQDTSLFNDTIRNNITFGMKRKISDEELMSVTKKSRIYEFIKTLPEGFNTLVGDRGVKLSGGEKQRLAISRALLKRSEILILDEATSSLDSKTERHIREAIDEAIKDKTAITIAHRFSTIRNADKIVFIEHGEIMEQGTLKELIDKKSKFYELWNEQKFD